MPNSLRFLLLSCLIIAGGCSQSEAIQNNSEAAETVTVADLNIENSDRGLVTVDSPYSVAETGDRLAEIITDKGLTLFTRIDHSANAEKAELELQPTQLIILAQP